MLVMIKSAPDTTDGALGLTLAKEGGADLVLLKDAEMDERVKNIDYDTLTAIMTGSDKVAGMF
jgi:hypothetical protein